MKNKFLLGAIALCCSAFSAFADGYTDGIDYYNAGQYANARTILERTINDAGTNKALSYYYLGQIEVLYKDFAKAKQYFDKGIAADPKSPYNYVGLGTYYLAQNNTKDAEANFKEATKLGKKDTKVPVEIARSYYMTATRDGVSEAQKKKDMDQVNKYLDKARKDSKFMEPAIYILEGDMLLDQRQLGDAAVKYEMATNYDKDNPEGYVKYSKAYMFVNPDYSVRKLQELLQKQPNSALAQRELAERYYEMDQWGKAVEQYAKYINNPNHFPEDKGRYSFLLYIYKKYDDALAVCNEILAETPNDIQAQRIKMLTLHNLDRNPEALTVAEAFLNMPGNPTYTATDYNTYGNILSALDKKAEALAAFQKGLTVDPNNLTTLKNVAFAYSDLDESQKAAETMQQVVDNTEDPNSTLYTQAAALWYLAARHADTDDLKTADANKGLANIDKVLAENPKDINAIRRKAQLLQNRDLNQPTADVAKAYQALVVALDADPANLNPANGKLGWYDDALVNIYQYYKAIGDTDNTEATVSRLNQIRAIQ